MLMVCFLFIAENVDVMFADLALVGHQSITFEMIIYWIVNEAIVVYMSKK